MASQRPEQSEFVSLLTSHQRRLYGYIAAFLPNPVDTEEVLQLTNVVLWSKADDFALGTSFRAWAFRIAHLEVLAYLRRCSRDRHLFGGALIETMAAETSHWGDEPTMQALHQCLAKLSEPDRQLLERRYVAGGSVKDVAIQTKRRESSVYRSLDRIRYALLECIQRATDAERRS